VDIDTASAATRVPQATLVQADIESGPWPLLVDGVAPQQFDAVIITNYLWRPLMGTLLACLAPGGVLLYETFSQGNETVGRPARAEFLLQPGELLQTFAPLQVVAYENGYLENPPRFVQRIAAVRPAGSGQPPTLPDVYRL
jgi:SAM-dependent methyltransferase